MEINFISYYPTALLQTEFTCSFHYAPGPALCHCAAHVHVAISALLLKRGARLLVAQWPAEASSEQNKPRFGISDRWQATAAKVSQILRTEEAGSPGAHWETSSNGVL